MAKTKYTRKKAEDYTLSEEVATEQIIDLLEYYDIDIEQIGDADEKAAKGLETVLDTLCRHIRTGKLTVDRGADDKLVVTQTLTNGETLTYSEISAKSKLAMEKYNNDSNYSRIYAFMGSLSGVGKAGIEKLSAKDLGVVEVLGAVFSNA